MMMMQPAMQSAMQSAMHSAQPMHLKPRSTGLLPTVFPTWCDVIAARPYPPNHAPAWPAGMGLQGSPSQGSSQGSIPMHLLNPPGPNPGSPPLHPVALAGYSHRNGYVPLCQGRPASTACPDLGHALDPSWLVYNEGSCTL